MPTNIGNEFRQRISNLLRQPACQAFIACSMAYALIWLAGITHDLWSPATNGKITEMHIIVPMILMLGAAIAFGISTAYVAARDAWQENEANSE